MSKLRFDVEGLDELINKLDFTKSLIKEGVKIKVKESSFTVEREAKKRITRNKSVITGNLRRSISTQILNNGYSGMIGSNVEYAPYVEFGTRKSQAKPYLIPSYYEEMDKYVQEMDKLVEKATK